MGSAISRQAIDLAAAHILKTAKSAPGTILGANGRPLAPSANYNYRRSGAKRTGSLKNWIPQRLLSRQEEARERERIVERSVDLVNNDPHGAGIADTFATTIIGSGLKPHPIVDHEILGLDKDLARKLQKQQRAIYQSWAPFADAGGRMNFGAIQYLAERNLVQYGEYLILVRMLDDPTRPYSLALQVINPLRLRTPVDLEGKDKIQDGVELGRYGQPVAYWIKKADPSSPTRYMLDTSDNFIRITAKHAHRHKVLHGFICQEPEQVRGMPMLAPSLKMFKDFHDLLDAELVSNIVTAALSYFIEMPTGVDPFGMADSMADTFTPSYTQNNREKVTRYQDVAPGQILYGNKGEKPHMLAATRPGVTFEPFLKTVKKSIALSANIPYPVLFKDVEGVNFAGFRSAMLEAWRTFSYRRSLRGADLCQPIGTMLMEEAWLLGHLDIGEFYPQMHQLTRAEWRGAPKGDIEPYKQAMANIALNNHRLKPKSTCIAELDGDADYLDVFDQIEEEEQLLADKKIPVAGEPSLITDDKEDDNETD